MGEVPYISSKNREKWGKFPNEQGHKEHSSWGVKPNWPQLNDLCSNTGLIPVQIFQFGFLRVI
jgi:hypothetical protein